MPRKARIDAPGALHHIIVRGIERRNIFYNDQDRNNFLERLGVVLTETGTPCSSERKENCRKAGFERYKASKPIIQWMSPSCSQVVPEKYIKVTN